MNSQEAIKACLDEYKPDLKPEIIAAHKEAERLFDRVRQLSDEIEEHNQAILRLQTIRSQIGVRANALVPRLEYMDQLRLEPVRIIAEMRTSATGVLAMLAGTDSEDRHWLGLIADILSGERPASAMVSCCSIIGEENADIIYKALLAEAGVTLEAVRAKQAEIAKLGKQS